MAVAINIMDGYGLNNKVHYTKRVITLNVHFIRVGIPRFLHHKQGDITAKQSDDATTSQIYLIWHLPSMLWMGVVLVTKGIVSTFQRTQQCHANCSFHKVSFQCLSMYEQQVKVESFFYKDEWVYA